jgi:MerR family transcriptional regulator, light-induced transcriptional regulator
MAEARYRIGAVARMTGLSTHVIRVWQRRYDALEPDRSSGGARLYSSSDVERLRLLKRAVDQGNAIGQIVKLDTAALSRLAHTELEMSPSAASAERVREQLVQAVRKFDVAQAERILTRASATFSPRSFAVDVLAPTLELVGDAWENGKLCAASEHIASSLVRDHAGALLREYLPIAEAETMVAATPANELHELGVLLASVTAAMHGFRVAYLGPNLPANEIAQAVKRTSARVVLLSVVALSKRAALRELRALRRELPPRVELIIGGARGLEISRDLGSGVTAPGSLSDFENWLNSRGK